MHSARLSAFEAQSRDYYTISIQRHAPACAATGIAIVFLRTLSLTTPLSLGGGLDQIQPRTIMAQLSVRSILCLPASMVTRGKLCRGATSHMGVL